MAPNFPYTTINSVIDVLTTTDTSQGATDICVIPMSSTANENQPQQAR